jgi:hypothetical protein
MGGCLLVREEEAARTCILRALLMAHQDLAGGQRIGGAVQEQLIQHLPEWYAARVDSRIRNAVQHCPLSKSLVDISLLLFLRAHHAIGSYVTCACES